MNQLQTCPVCHAEVEALFSSGAVPIGCCSKCYDAASRRAIEKACNPAGDIQKQGVTTKTTAAAIKEILK